MAKSSKTKVAAEIGFGLALAAAAVVGAYYLTGERGKKNRKKIKSWAFKMKGEILERMEKLWHIDEKRYHDIVDAVSRRYKKLKTVNNRELAELTKELKGHWKNVRRELTTHGKKKKGRR